MPSSLQATPAMPIGVAKSAKRAVMPGGTHCGSRGLQPALGVPLTKRYIAQAGTFGSLALGLFSMRLFLSALAALLLLQALPASAAELVVSTSDLSVQVSGPWQTASVADNGPAYLFRPAGAGGATVYWPFPTTLGAGQYQVF